jgi:hypothetical protein
MFVKAGMQESTRMPPEILDSSSVGLAKFHRLQQPRVDIKYIQLSMILRPLRKTSTPASTKAVLAAIDPAATQPSSPSVSITVIKISTVCFQAD